MNAPIHWDSYSEVFCLVWLWPVDFAWFSSAPAVTRCFWSLEALVDLCRLWPLFFRVVPFLGVCVIGYTGIHGDMLRVFAQHMAIVDSRFDIRAHSIFSTYLPPRYLVFVLPSSSTVTTKGQVSTTSCYDLKPLGVFISLYVCLPLEVLCVCNYIYACTWEIWMGNLFVEPSD
jgi:hypothetical protein